MKVMWKGAISFGLVNVPVNMYAATSKKDIKFKYLHRDCYAPVNYKRVCSACNKELNQEEIIKAYEYEPGNYVQIEEEELENIAGEKSKTIDILDFVNLEEIDPVYYDKTYYLSPRETGERAYLLLKKALENKSKVAVCRMMIRSKENLGCLRVYQGVLTFETMYYPDEVRNVEDVLDGELNVEVKDNELEMADKLIDNLSTNFEPDKYKDRYREALLDLITSKVEGKEIKIPAREKEDKVVNLMEALKESVEMVEKEKVNK